MESFDPTPDVPLSQYNLAAASHRDGASAVLGAARPGHAHPAAGTRTPRGPLIPRATVLAWTTFMRKRGVARVVCLLTPEELTFFAESYLETLRSQFPGPGRVMHVILGSPNARRQLLVALSAAVTAKETVVVHCATGQERTGNALALWLHHKYHLSVEEAVVEVSDFAKAHGATRRPSVKGVLRLLSNTPGRTRAPPPTPPPPSALARRNPGRASITSVTSSLYGGASSLSVGSGLGATHTPRPPTGAMTARSTASRATFAPPLTARMPAPAPSDPATHVTFVQTGGTIDKDYPRNRGGYAFEIGSAAAKRVMARMPVPPGFTYDAQTACRKDSTDLTATDRETVLARVSEAVGLRVVVTHGTDTLIETAKFLLAKHRAATGRSGPDSGSGAGGAGAGGAGAGAGGGSSSAAGVAGAALTGKTVVLTGSMRPERFVDSDASFNLGGAVVAATILPPGVYVCMHGRAYRADDCERGDEGGFRAKALPA